MHILDTDTLSHLYKNHPNVTENLRALDDPDVGTTIITKIELLQGRFDFLLKAKDAVDLLRAQGRLDRTEELLAQIIILPMNEAAATEFERLKKIKGLRKIGRADLLIAAISLTHHATLVTRNLKHFQKVPGLTLTNWVD